MMKRNLTWARKELSQRLSEDEQQAVKHLVFARHHLTKAEQFLHSSESECNECGLTKQDPHTHWMAETSRKSALTRVLRALDQFSASWLGEWDFPEIDVSEEKTAS